MPPGEGACVSGGDECLPFLQMGQHCSGSYTGFTHSGTAQSDTTQCTSLFGSQRHHSQGEGCEQRRGGQVETRFPIKTAITCISHWRLEKAASSCIIQDVSFVSSQTGSDIMRGRVYERAALQRPSDAKEVQRNF